MSLLEQHNARLARSLASLSANADFDIEEFEKEAEPVQQRLAAARVALKDAEKFAASFRAGPSGLDGR